MVLLVVSMFVVFEFGFVPSVKANPSWLSGGK